MKNFLTILICVSFHKASAKQISVKDYGAKGDGISIDSTAIKNALSSGASVIHFPTGKYNVSTCTLVIKAGITIYGEMGSVIISSGIRFRAGSYPSTLAAAILITGNNVIIRNISIISSGDQRSSYVGISIQNASNVSVKNCVIKGFAFMGVRNNGTQNFLFSKNNIKQIGSPTSVLKDSTSLSYAAPYGISGSGSSMKFNDNRIDSIGDWDDRQKYSYGAGIYESGLKIVVSNNRISEFGAVAIKVFASPNGNISNNIIETNRRLPGRAGCIGIITDEEGQGNGEGVIIADNIINARNNFTYGIYAADGSKKYTIQRNTIRIRNFEVVAGMAFERSRDGIITSNIISADSRNVHENFGIYVTNQFSMPGDAGVRNLTFVDNIISNIPYGYYLSGAQDISISGGKVSMDSVVPSACIFIRPYNASSVNISISGVTFFSKAPGYIYNISDSTNAFRVENINAFNNFIYSDGNYWFVGAGNRLIHMIRDHDVLGTSKVNEKYINKTNSVSQSIINK